MIAVTPPHDPAVEEALIAAALQDPSVLAAREVEALPPEAFYIERHRHLWAALRALVDEGLEPDMVLVADKLAEMGRLEEVGGMSALAGYYGLPVSLAMAPAYARTIAEHYRRRRIIHAAGEAMRLAYAREDIETILRALERHLDAFAEGREDRTAEDYYREAEAILAGSGGLPTGIDDLDRFTGGLTKPGMTLLAARPSMGKTALARLIAINHMERGGRVFWLSIDQAGGQLFLLEAARRAHVSLDSMRKSQELADRVRLALAEVRELFAERAILLDLPLSLDQLITKARAAARWGADLVIVDYIQLVHAPGDSAQAQVARVSKSLKSLALELGVAILALAQLSRAPEARVDKRPVLADLRDSGQLEQDADQVWFLYRDDYYDAHSAKAGVAEILIRKHKTGPTGAVELAWIPRYATFAPLARGVV